jgi:Flp pilus assembly protein CpaB
MSDQSADMRSKSTRGVVAISFLLLLARFLYNRLRRRKGTAPMPNPGQAVPAGPPPPLPTPPLTYTVRLAVLAVILGVTSAGYLRWQEGQELRMSVPVPLRDIQVDQLVKDSDLDERSLPVRQLGPNVISKTADIVNHYAIAAIAKGQPISTNQIDAAAKPGGTVAMPVEVNTQVLLGSNVMAGDTVDILILAVAATVTSTAQPTRSPLLFANLPVLAVTTAANGQGTAAANIGSVPAVVIQLPRERRTEFALAVVNGTVLITKRK